MANDGRVRPIARALLVVVLLTALLTLINTGSGYSAFAQSGQDEVTVWVNTNSGIYWCPGSRWYGKTKQGKYMKECEARKAGYRPAYNKPCGSTCQ